LSRPLGVEARRPDGRRIVVTARPGYTRPELLAETSSLQEHLNDPTVRILDCEVFDAYRRAHIPGAVGLRVAAGLKDANDPLHIMPPEQFARLMGELGVSNDTTVVTYDAGGIQATRIWWALSYHGHTNVKVLNGGWTKWLMEGRPIVNRVTTPQQAAFTPRMAPEVSCDLARMKSAVESQGPVILDVRTEAEFTGEQARGLKRGGHMPGAVRIDWPEFMTRDEPRVFRSAEELRALLAARGVHPEREVITY